MASQILVATALSRRLVLVLGALSILTAAAAGETGNFTDAALKAAQKAGKPILVDITASWCPTCRAQKPILSELIKRDKFRNVVVLEVDFDSQKDVVRSLNARNQSTLIVFKGATEVGRSAGDTDAASIETLLSLAL